MYYFKHHKIYEVPRHKYIKTWAIFSWRKYKPKVKEYVENYVNGNLYHIHR